MSDPILCKRCGQRRARRFCPALQAEICTICCGTEREVSISCPLDCEYLREAHKHEKPLPADPNDKADLDVEISEAFLRDHQELLLFAAHSLLQAALRTPGAVDSDVVSALEAEIKTYRTSESGLIYETRPDNLVAAAVQRAFSASLADYRKTLAEGEVIAAPRDREIMPMLIFLRRFALINLNGRPRGRMFLDVLRQMTPLPGIEERAPGIITL